MRAERKSVAPFMAGLAAFTLLFTAASYMIAVVLTNYFSELSGEERPIPVSAAEDFPLVIVDPGHGGEDGGATSGEVLEKDLNLEVATSLCGVLRFIGVPVEATRESDTALYSLYGDLEDYGGKKKTFDLCNRLRFAEEKGGDVFVSIHANKFPDPRYGGLQVYYSASCGGSREIAEAIQSLAREKLDPSNGREVKPATSAIYVLDRAKIPSVLVECGFLSNAEDLERLTSSGYRLRLAACIASALAGGSDR